MQGLPGSTPLGIAPAYFSGDKDHLITNNTDHTITACL